MNVRSPFPSAALPCTSSDAPVKVRVGCSANTFHRMVDIRTWLAEVSQTQIDAIVKARWRNPMENAWMNIALLNAKNEDVIAMYDHVNLIARGEGTDDVGVVTDLWTARGEITAWLRSHRTDLILPIGCDL